MSVRIIPLVVVGGLVVAGMASAKSLAVVPDGSFEEWGRRKARVADSVGDGEAEGLDLGRLWVADDGEALFLRLEVGRETLLQNSDDEAAGNRLRLYLDLDAKASTGLPLGSLGVDLEIRFGEREVLRYDDAGIATPESVGSGVYQALPTHSASEFEIRVMLPAAEGLATAEHGKRRKLKLLLQEDTLEGDRLPNSGVLVYKLGKKMIDPAEEILLVTSPEALRVVSFNVERSTLTRLPDLYSRFLQTIEPDVLCLQELGDWTSGQAVEFVSAVLPDKSWVGARVADVHVVSSLPIIASADIDGNIVSHLDLPGRLSERDLVIFNAHIPCCDNDAGRDEEVDNLAATWRDLLDGRGPFAIAPDDAMVLLGDFNLVGFKRQLDGLRDGVFIDSTRGPNFSPGRDEGSLRNAPLRHAHRRLIHTWRNADSLFSPGKLDYVFYTGDALELVKSFVVDTEGMPADVLDATGLRARDSARMSDHLPLVVDFEVRP